MKRSTSIVFAAMIAAGLSWGADAAPDNSILVRSVQVRYGDLNLNSAQDAAVLRTRVEHAAAMACGGSDVVYDFRPGLPLESCWSVFVRAAEATPGREAGTHLTVRLGILPSLASRSVLTAAVCALRSPSVWLALSSTMTMATLARLSRCSSRKVGLASEHNLPHSVCLGALEQPRTIGLGLAKKAELIRQVFNRQPRFFREPLRRQVVGVAPCRCLADLDQPLLDAALEVSIDEP